VDPNRTPLRNPYPDAVTHTHHLAQTLQDEAPQDEDPHGESRLPDAEPERDVPPCQPDDDDRSPGTGTSPGDRS
jgi:hypothetical protein